MQHAFHILFVFQLLWHLTPGSQLARSRTAPMLEAIAADTDPESFVAQGVHEWSSEVVNSMYKSSFPLNSHFMSSHSTMQMQIATNSFTNISFVILVLLTVLFVVFWFRSSATDEDHITGFVAQNSKAPWAQAFQEAVGTRRDAIDMLYRCNIVSLEEFTDDSVERERIEEFCWVAVNMLLEQPANEWVCSGTHAKETFERSFKSSFPARSGKVFDTGSLPVQAVRLPGQKTPPMPALRLPIYGTPWQGINTGPPSASTNRSMLTATDTGRISLPPTASSPPPTWQQQRADLDSSIDSAITPRESMRYFEQHPAASDNPVNVARSLPLHLLGPTPNIFKKEFGSGRKAWRSADGQSSGSGLTPKGRPLTPGRGEMSLERIKEDKTPLRDRPGAGDVPVVD